MITTSSKPSGKARSPGRADRMAAKNGRKTRTASLRCNRVLTRPPCLRCSISRVTTIAQNNVTTYIENGDLFASDPFGNTYLHYMQTAFGEWESNCAPGTSLCTFVYSLHPTKYYAGYQYYPNESDARSIINPSLASTNGPWESWDGINMNCCSASGKSVMTAGGAFTLTLPSYSWRSMTYKNPGVERVTNWEITTDNGSTWDTYCTASHISDSPPYQDLGGETCDGMRTPTIPPYRIQAE